MTDPHTVTIPKRALIYIRKSVVRSGADTVSPERQREACLSEAAVRGHPQAESVRGIEKRPGNLAPDLFRTAPNPRRASVPPFLPFWCP